MAEVEQFTTEQAQKLLEEAFETKTPANATIIVAPADTSTATPVTPVVPEPVPAKTEEPKPAATQEQPAKTEVKPEATPAAATPTDPYSWVRDVPEALREKVLQEINGRMQADHAFRSNNGRIRALQQKLLEAESRTPTPTAPPPATVATPPSTPEGWTEVMKSDPDLAKAIEARVKSEVDNAVTTVKTEIQELKKTGVDPLHDHARRQYVAEERAQLKRLIPNVDEVIASPVYSDWLDNIASPGIRDLALRSTDHRDAYVVMQHYAADMTARNPAPTKTATTPAATTQSPAAVTPPADTSEADRIAAEREARLKAPSTVPASTPSLTGPGSNNGPVTKEMQERIFLEEWGKLHPKKT